MLSVSRWESKREKKRQIQKIKHFLHLSRLDIQRYVGANHTISCLRTWRIMHVVELHRIELFRAISSWELLARGLDDEYKSSIHKATRITELFSRSMYKRQGSRLGIGRDKWYTRRRAIRDGQLFIALLFVGLRKGRKGWSSSRQPRSPSKRSTFAGDCTWNHNSASEAEKTVRFEQCIKSWTLICYQYC